MRSWRTSAATLAALLVSVPVGFAIAEEVADEPELGVRDCPSEVNGEYESRNLPAPYGPPCPTSEEAEASATEASLLKREGLTEIRDNIRLRGGPDDAEQLRAVEEELEAYGGEYYAPDEEPLEARRGWK